MTPTILYVEDHPPARLLMRAIVEDLTDYTLVEAVDGPSAVVACREHRPDLYILDVDLPETDGVTLGQQLIEIHRAPLILVSAYAEAIQTGGLPGHVQSYLAKPLDPEHVARTLRHALS